MATITIRNLDDEVKRRLRVRAAANHRSMEEEVRIILRDAVKGGPTAPRDLANFTRECFASLGGYAEPARSSASRAGFVRNVQLPAGCLGSCGPGVRGREAR